MKLKLDSFRIPTPLRPSAPTSGGTTPAPATPGPVSPQPPPDVFTPPADPSQLQVGSIARARAGWAIQDFAMNQRMGPHEQKSHPDGSFSSGLSREEFNAKAKAYLAERHLLEGVSDEMLDQLLADGYETYTLREGGMSQERRRPSTGSNN